ADKGKKDAPPDKERVPPPADKTKPRTKEEAAKLRKDFEAHADEFEIYLGRHGFGSAKIDLKSIALVSSNRRFEPSVLGPSGKPIFKSARITKEQALKIIAVIAGEDMDIFRTARFTNPSPQSPGVEEPYLSTRISYGSDAKPGPQLVYLVQGWGWHSLFKF